MATSRREVPFEKEDYIAVKKYAYEYVENGGSRELKDIQDLITKNLNLPLDWTESKIISSTILFPYDREFCEAYKKDLNNSMFYIDGSLVSHACLETKKKEIFEYGLDQLIESGELNPPEQMENSSKMSRK